MILAEEIINKELEVIFEGSHEECLSKLTEITKYKEINGYMLINDQPRYSEFANSNGWHSIIYLADSIIKL